MTVYSWVGNLTQVRRLRVERTHLSASQEGWSLTADVGVVAKREDHATPLLSEVWLSHWSGLASS